MSDPEIVMRFDSTSFNTYAQNAIKAFETIGYGIEAMGGAIGATYGIAIQAATQIVRLYNQVQAAKIAVMATGTLGLGTVLTITTQTAAISALTVTLFQMRAGRIQAAAQTRKYAQMFQSASYLAY